MIGGALPSISLQGDHPFRLSRRRCDPLCGGSERVQTRPLDGFLSVCTQSAAALGRQAMRARSLFNRHVCTTLTSIVLAGLGATAESQDLPSYMAPISGHTVSSPADTAMKN